MGAAPELRFGGNKAQRLRRVFFQQLGFEKHNCGYEKPKARGGPNYKS